MECSNWIGDNRERFTAEQRAAALRTLSLMLAPITPFLAEELWARLGGVYSVHQQTWPAFDPAQVVEETVTLIVQVNGKVRERLTLPSGTTQEEARTHALRSTKVRSHVAGKQVHDTFWVPDKLINLVVG